MSVETDRRTLVKTAVATALSAARVVGANDRIRIGGMGVGGRARYLIEQLLRLVGAELVAVSDAYGPRRDEIRQKLAPGAREYVEYRELLEQKGPHQTLPWP